MADYSKLTGPRTEIWKRGPGGRVLVKIIEGLPYGKTPIIQIPEFGEAQLAGIEISGSGPQETIIAVSYVLN